MRSIIFILFFTATNAYAMEDVCPKLLNLNHEDVIDINLHVDSVYRNYSFIRENLRACSNNTLAFDYKRTDISDWMPVILTLGPNDELMVHVNPDVIDPHDKIDVSVPHCAFIKECLAKGTAEVMISSSITLVISKVENTVCAETYIETDLYFVSLSKFVITCQTK